MKVNIQYLDNYVGKPMQYETKGSSGFDIRAALHNKVTIFNGVITIVPAGFSIAIPEGYELQIRPRSGLAAKKGLVIVNSPGTIDSDYRGEIKIILSLLNQISVNIEPGDRIAQGIIAPIVQADLVEVDNLELSERGGKGFGSTGIK